MMEYKEGEVIVATPCEHVFHKRCCQEWLQLSRTCPVCRKDLPDALTAEGVEENIERRQDTRFRSDITSVERGESLEEA